MLDLRGLITVGLDQAFSFVRRDNAVEMEELVLDDGDTGADDREAFGGDVVVLPVVATEGDHLIKGEGVVDGEVGYVTHFLIRIESRKELLESVRILNPALHYLCGHLGDVFGNASQKLCGVAIVGFRRHDVFS